MRFDLLIIINKPLNFNDVMNDLKINCDINMLNNFILVLF